MVELKFADMHTHTIASDGVNAPAENVQMAYSAGLAAIAITDHDTIAGIEEAVQEGKRLGITVVPGVEISTIMQGADIHILGYYINYKDTGFLDRLESLRKTRERRNQLLLERLREIGIEISMADVMKEKSNSDAEDETIGRPHIAQALVRKGVVTSVREAFDRYLGKDGAAYVNTPRIRPEEAVAWIRAAGGKAVLAHPGIYGNDDWVIEILRGGMDGLEVYHSDHSPEQENRYREIADQHGLIVTAGSDFHGRRENELFHGDIGNRKISIDVLDQLRS